MEITAVGTTIPKHCNSSISFKSLLPPMCVRGFCVGILQMIVQSCHQKDLKTVTLLLNIEKIRYSTVISLLFIASQTAIKFELLALRKATTIIVRDHYCLISGAEYFVELCGKNGWKVEKRHIQPCKVL